MPNLINLSMDDLKIFSKIKGIRDFKNMSEERLISSINESVKKKKEENFDDSRIEKIKIDFNELRDKLSKPKIKGLEKIFIE